MGRILMALLALTLTLSLSPAQAQEAAAVPVSVNLWPNGAPGSEKRRDEPEVARDYWVRNVHNPSLTIFRPVTHSNGAAMVVLPGGGHRLIVWTTEGVNVARALNRYGLTVFVLKYRLAREAGSHYSIERDAAADTRRAIRWVRAHAVEYGIDPNRVGLMGFSAGGELVSLVADNRDPNPPAAHDTIDRLSPRPDFQVLVFPGPLGTPANAAVDAPPAFLIAGSLDDCCAAPAVKLYEQLRTGKVPAELHMYAGAGHAFNLGESNRISVLHWPDRLADWLADEGWLDAKPRRAAAK